MQHALRLSVLVIVLIAGLSSAAGTYATCPSTATSGMYSRPTSNCTSGTACHTTYCTCAGGTINANTGVCTYTTAPTCATLTGCARTFVGCMDALAATVGNSSDVCFASMQNLRTAVLSLVAGNVYNVSGAQSACQNFFCNEVNNTASDNCTLGYDYVCRPSVTYTGRLGLSGDFSRILSNASAKSDLINCLTSDLSAFLKFPTNITAVSLSATNSLVVDFVVATGSANPVLSMQLAALTPSNTAWLVCLSTAKFASLGGNGTLGVAGIITPAPPTPAPTTGTPAPSTAAPTPAPRAAGSSLSWTLAQILVAIAAVLFIA